MPSPLTTTGTRTPSRQPKLSEVARHLVLPEGIVATDWPAVRSKCADLGLTFDRWQDGAGRCILAKREDGLYAAGIGGAAMSIPRQVGKTYLIGAIAFAMCMLFPGLTVLWTAHRTRTADEVFTSMQAMAAKPRIKPHLLPGRAGITRGSGKQAINFANGSRILFGARDQGFGLGFTKVGMVVFDEAQRLTTTTLDDMIPATNSARNPLVIMVGTPPRPTDDGDVFAEKRAAALSEEPDPDVLYVELSAPSSVDPTSWPPGFMDWSAVAGANPSFPHRTPSAAIKRMLKLLGHESFRREGLGIWDDATVGAGVITKDHWARSLRPDATMVDAPVFALDASPMLTRACIVAAGHTADGKTAVEVTGSGGVIDCRPGVEWAVELLSSRPGLEVWVASGSAAEAVVERLRDAGVRVEVMARPAYAQACVTFASAAVRGDAIVHRAQKPLEDAVIAGAKRSTDEGLWVWGRVKSSADITPLVAATVAAAALEQRFVSAYEDSGVEVV